MRLGRGYYRNQGGPANPSTSSDTTNPDTTNPNTNTHPCIRTLGRHLVYPLGRNGFISEWEPGYRRLLT